MMLVQGEAWQTNETKPIHTLSYAERYRKIDEMEIIARLIHAARTMRLKLVFIWKFSPHSVCMFSRFDVSNWFLSHRFGCPWLYGIFVFEQSNRLLHNAGIAKWITCLITWIYMNLDFRILKNDFHQLELLPPHWQSPRVGQRPYEVWVAAMILNRQVNIFRFGRILFLGFHLLQSQTAQRFCSGCERFFGIYWPYEYLMLLFLQVCGNFSFGFQHSFLWSMYPDVGLPWSIRRD